MGGPSTNLSAWREAKHIASHCSLVTPIVTSPLLLIAGLIKHSKLCPPMLTRKHLWMTKKTGLSGSKRQDLRAFWTQPGCRISQSMWVQVTSDRRTVSTTVSAIPGFHAAGRYQGERCCTFSLERPHNAASMPGLRQPSGKDTEAQLRNAPQTRSGPPRRSLHEAHPGPRHPGRENHTPASSLGPGPLSLTHLPCSDHLIEAGLPHMVWVFFPPGTFPHPSPSEPPAESCFQILEQVSLQTLSFPLLLSLVTGALMEVQSSASHAPVSVHHSVSSKHSGGGRNKGGKIYCICSCAFLGF